MVRTLYGPLLIVQCVLGLAVLGQNLHDGRRPGLGRRSASPCTVPGRARRVTEWNGPNWLRKS